MEAIECSIALLWPDVEAIQRRTGATRHEIDAVMSRLEAGEGRDHDAALSDLEAYRDSLPEGKDVLLVAHNAYHRYRYRGEVPPAWVMEGAAAYARRQQIGRQSSLSAGSGVS